MEWDKFDRKLWRGLGYTEDFLREINTGQEGDKYLSWKNLCSLKKEIKVTIHHTVQYSTVSTVEESAFFF